ncbi:BTAD domain-containing putative transcriptional regulator [Streptomyces sp. NBC_00878]|uniref:BTAD domain-containing putative transcriptional regulator n=1 Tax=Streptomyces sp. NBC_00878 TaxID=2975854 RepID=UPI00225B5FE8|nr:BTAD domain-containing putative transcriptional regulator [Streptomyces sp. NBC_00878]MCX4908957.1 AAA family ATPase [Streptomyces sp. NBC_00878]
MSLQELRMTVLGEVGAAFRAQPLELGGRRQRAVLALLIVARGSVVARDRLIEEVWGGTPPPSAAASLQAHVSHLRRSLEPEREARTRGGIIVSDGAGYALRLPADAVDAWRFEQALRSATTHADEDRPSEAVSVLETGLGLWRGGPAYAEYAAEPWARQEAARLAGLRELACERLLAARLARGEDTVLVPELESLVSQDPLREERWRLLALALYRAHRQADALDALRRARQILPARPGTPGGHPGGQALRALESEILNQSPALDAPDRRTADLVRGSDGTSAAPGAGPAGPTAPAAAPAGQVPRLPVRTDLLVDRAPQLAELRRCLRSALDGEPRVVLIEGPAGIGKSRLLSEVAGLAAEEGILTLTARGSQREKDYGFGTVRQLFERVVDNDGTERTERVVDDDGTERVVGDEPHGANVPGGRVSLVAGAAVAAGAVFGAVRGRPPASFAVLNGLYQLARRLVAARGPLVLAVDDVQWCDSGSVRFLAHLPECLEGLPVLIALTLRTGEPPQGGELPGTLTRGPSVVRITPTPLTATGVADLVRQTLGEEPHGEFTASCHRATAGNPLLLRQLLRALHVRGIRPGAAQSAAVTETGSQAVSGLVLGRLARLPEQARTAAQAVAVLGDGAATLSEVAALMERPEAQTARAIVPLVRAEILREGHPYGFVHPLVGEAVYRELPPGERQLRHERAARALSAAGAPAERTAAQLLLAPHRGDPGVVDLLRAAAREAVGRAAPDAAATYLTRALDEPPPPECRPDVLLELGRAETLGNGPAAVEHLRLAYGTLADPGRKAAAALLLARILVFASGHGQATEFARRAAAELPAELRDERQGLLALERISGFMHGLDQRLWRTVEDPVVEGEGPGARMLAANLAREAASDGSERARAAALARFAIADGVLQAAGEEMLWYTAAIVLHLADEEVGELWDAALARAQERGSLFSVLATHLWRGFAQWNHGDLDAARRSLENAVELSEIWGLAPGAPQGRTFLTAVLLDLGDTAGARACLERMRGWVRGAEGQRLLGESEARVLIEEGRYEEALAALDGVRHLQPAVANPAWWPWSLLRVRALAGAGKRADALVLAEEQLTVARGWGAPSTLGRVLRIVCELRGAAGEPGLREAVALLATGPARLEYARALYALAEYAPADEAASFLSRGRHIARECGATRLAEGARQQG